MQLIRKLTNEQFARSAARLMKFVCYFVICFYVFGTLLSFMGRQTFVLHTQTGTFEHAICAEEDHDPPFRSMTVSIGDDIHVWTNDQDGIDPIIWIGISLMYAFYTVPMSLAYYLLSRVFSNIDQGQIFVQQNAAYLLYYGMLQFSAAVLLPFFKLLVCGLINLVSNGRMSIATGADLFRLLIPSIAFMVAAYIIHYGVHLQDEVDHTL